MGVLTPDFKPTPFWWDAGLRVLAPMPGIPASIEANEQEIA